VLGGDVHVAEAALQRTRRVHRRAAARVVDRSRLRRARRRSRGQAQLRALLDRERATLRAIASRLDRANT
jgi:hypothetical protein